MKFSIIVPVKEINDYIYESVPICLKMNFDDFEIIILPNDLPGNVLPILDHPKIKIVASGRVSPAVKRDIGAKMSSGDYLAFLDDDAYPAKDWLQVAEETFLKTKAQAIGGPAITPSSNSLSQQASGLFFETLVGGGGMAYRYRPGNSSFYVDDFPTVNLIVEKKAFLAVGGFGNQFWPGEDTKFCLEFVKAGYKIWYANNLIVWHHRRSLMMPHLKQVGGYGKHRGHFARVFPSTSRRLVYFVPTLFLLANVFLPLLAFTNAIFFQIWVLMLTAYFLLSLIDVFYRTRNIQVGLATVLVIFCSHLTYGFMFIEGFFTKKLHSPLR